MISAPRIAARAAAGAPAVGQPPILALSPPCALGAGGSARHRRQGTAGSVSARLRGKRLRAGDAFACRSSKPLWLLRGLQRLTDWEQVLKLAWRRPCLPPPLLPRRRSRSTFWEPGFPSAVNQGGQTLSGLPPRSGELNARRGAGLAAKGLEGAASSRPRLFRPGTAGIPGYKRARAPTLTLTHTRPHTHQLQAWAAERSLGRAQRTGQLLSGVGQKALAL